MRTIQYASYKPRGDAYEYASYKESHKGSHKKDRTKGTRASFYGTTANLTIEPSVLLRVI